ncbi:MAG: hypothetical protein JJ892_01380 [Balneola sp.]|nr:hypothetical protein [Balneola sp.]MBO6650389.1 hypothetical protein [Balneola sp.]MBO6710214.1 hypothetical protein [Balneola sp.]MBO6798899.1 hypothetical protein [Balneola sp.]MBO6870013.1 hypothetical protein [Balneola sp.]
MKILSKFFFLLVINFALISQLCNAQVKSINAIVDIKAEIIQSIELITIKGMTINQLQPGQKEVYINPTNSANAGHMIAVGTPDADIRINFIKNKELTRIDGPGLLIFNYEVSGNTEDAQQTSELLGDDNRSLRFNNEGQFYIWVGGTINVEQATPGNYEGDFTIEIEYI